MKLFWRKGYEGVSLSDIMAETGLKKGSLYAAYGDKRAMYLKALGQYETDVVDSAARFLRGRSAPSMERISGFLSAPLEAAGRNDRSGCFLCNASADQADLDRDARKLIERGFDQLTCALVSALMDTDKNFSPDQVQSKARALLAVYIGLRVMVRSGTPTEALRAVVKQGLGIV